MQANVALLEGITSGAVILMGLCFLLGSLFTIFILVILDMVRAARQEHAKMLEQQAFLDDEDRGRDAD